MTDQIEHFWKWFAGIIMALFLLVFGFVLLPYASVVYEKAMLLGEQREQIAFMSNWQERLTRLDNRQEALNESMGAMTLNLAEQEEFSDVIKTFFDDAQSSYVTIARIQPLEETETQKYMKRELRLEVNGGYHGIAQFINSLEQGTYLVTTNSVSLSVNAEEQNLLTGIIDIEVTLMGGAS